MIMKQRIFYGGRRFFSNSSLKLYKRKGMNTSSRVDAVDAAEVVRGQQNLSVNDIFKSLPRVPTTRFLESTKLTNDILYSGYRPITYPVKENPLFRNIKREFDSDILAGEEGGLNGKEQQEKNVFNVLTGERGTGGIMSGGVNGTWRNNPKVPDQLQPYNWWSTSVMGMEYYPEWNNVPRRFLKDLKPFQLNKKLNKK